MTTAAKPVAPAKKDLTAIYAKLGEAQAAYEKSAKDNGHTHADTVKAYGQVRMCMDELADAEKTETPTTQYGDPAAEAILESATTTPLPAAQNEGYPGQTVPQTFSKAIAEVRTYAKTADAKSREQLERLASATESAVQAQEAQNVTLKNQLAATHELIKNYDKGLKNLEARAQASDARAIETEVSSEFNELKKSGCTALGAKDHMDKCIATATKIYSKDGKGAYEEFMSTFREAPKADLTQRGSGSRSLIRAEGAGATILENLGTQAKQIYSKARDDFDRAGIPATGDGSLAAARLAAAMAGDDDDAAEEQ